MPQFCRHNRFVHLCPICSREAGEQAPAPISRREGGLGSASRGGGTARRGNGTRAPSARSGGLRVHRLRRAAEDGYGSGLVPGLRASADAEFLAAELGFATGRLRALAADPPGLWAEVAGAADPEEALWLAFLIAWLGPLEDEDPFAAVSLVRRPWGEAESILPLDAEPAVGPRGCLEAGRAAATLTAYRGWAAKAGSQAAALAGEPGWSADRRFARAFERLSLPGFSRAARFDLITALGAVGRAEAEAGVLQLGVAGGGDTVAAAKRAFGIGDPMLLERRAAALAEAADVPLAALDLALAGFEHGERIHGGVGDDALDGEAEARARAALGV